MRHYEAILSLVASAKKGLAILIDPEDFELASVASFLLKLPKETTHILVGGSTANKEATQSTVSALKKSTNMPVFLFPGHFSQLTEQADAVLFLSLLSGRNPEYLIQQQIEAVSFLRNTNLDILSTAYILIDGGNQSAVERVSKTKPMTQTDVQAIVKTALAGQYMGAKLIYLEAGSGAEIPVAAKIISEVKNAINIPLIVGGGIRTETQKLQAYNAGADIVVMGTVFEELK